MSGPDSVVISRVDARQAGLTHFFTGVPCKHSHVTKRFVTSGDCFACSTNKRLADDNATKGARVKRWRQANRAKFNAQAREWYADNTEKAVLFARRWQKKNPDRVSELKVKWNSENAERIRETGTKWRLSNKEKVRANHARRWARKASAPGTFTDEHLVEKLSSQKFRCAAPHCASDIRNDYSVDHILPLSRGGSNWPDNIQLLCAGCNSSKRDRTMEEWLASPVTRKRVFLKENSA